MLKIESVSKVFNKGNIDERLALNNINLSINEGEFVTVIGSNGAGKSTLINCISGVNSIDEGRIILDCQDISNKPEHKRARFIGRIFQNPLRGTASNMTIKENLAIAKSKIKLRGLRAGLNDEDILLFKERLSILGLGLEDRMDQKIGTLSGGQRQAITLLMATIVKPKLLLLDEHTAALDPTIANKVLEITNSIVKKDNISTLMITHNMRDALKYGVRTIMMHEGRILLDVNGSEREKLTVEKLIDKFNKISNKNLYSDRLLL